MVHIRLGLCDGNRVSEREREREIRQNGLSTYNRLAKWLFTKCPYHFTFVSIFHVFGVNEISAEQVNWITWIEMCLNLTTKLVQNKNNYYFYDFPFNFTFWRVISIGFMKNQSAEPENRAVLSFCSTENRSIRLSMDRDWRRNWNRYGVSANRNPKRGSGEARKQFKQTSIFMCATDRLHTLWISIWFWMVSTRQ